MICDYITAFRDRFGVEPICRVLTAHGIQIAPSTYYARLVAPVSDAELADAYAVNLLVDGCVRLIWPHRDGLIWPHPVPLGDLSRV